MLLASGTLGTSDALVYYHPAWVARAFGWTTELYAGYPVQGDPQAMTWYPVALLLAWLPASFSWNAFVVSGYALAASFAYGYARRVTGDPLAAFVAGTAYGAGGYAIAHLDHVTMVHAMAWIPLVLWTLEALREELRAGWLLVGGLGVGATLLAGHPQIFLYAALLWSGYGIVAGVSAPAGRARYWLCTTVMGGLGVGLAAITWLPALELASHSTRSLVTRAEFFEFSLSLAQLPQLLFPYLFGGAVLGSVPPDVVPSARPLPYFGPGRFAEVTGYPGLLTLTLAGIALVRRPRSRLVAFWGVVAALSLLLALGDSLPALSELWYRLPGLDRFRVPPRHLVELSLAVAVLGALGTKTLAGMATAARTRVAGTALLLLLALATGGLAVYQAALDGGAFAGPLHWAAVAPEEAVPWRNPALGLQLWVAAIGAAALLWWSRDVGRSGRWLLALAVVLDLGAMAALGHWRMSPAPDPSRHIPEGLAPIRDALRASGQRMSALTFDAPDSAAPPNRNQLWDLPNALGYGPLVLEHYAELLGLGPAGLSPEQMGRVLTEEDRRLDLLAVRYLTVPDGSRPSEVVRRETLAFRPPRQGRSKWPQVVDYLDRQPRWQRHARLDGAVVYENTRALPRAWLVSDLRVLPADTVLRSIHEGVLPDGSAFDPRRTALLEETVDEPIADALACPEPCGEVTFVSDDGTRLELHFEAAGPALLVASDVHYPGWRAWLDGEPAPLHRVDHALRGVVVPAGAHTLRLELHSTSFRWGVGLTLASAVALLGLAARLERNRRTAPERTPGGRQPGQA